MAIGQLQAITPSQVSVTTVGSVTTGETTLGTSTLQAQVFTLPSSIMHVIAWGSVANNANAKSLKFYFGSASQAFTLPASVAYDWKLDAWFSSKAAASQVGTAAVTIGAIAATSAETYALATTENDLANIIVKITGTATTTNDITCKGFLVLT